ncbi:hypothetical protein ACOSQ2_015873 [Xanthoceras sorbifolium]
MGDERRQSYTVDEALTWMGFGKFQSLVFGYAGLGIFAEAMEVMILSFIGGAVKSEWELSSNNYGRKKGFLGIAMVTSVVGLLSAFSSNYGLLMALRGLAGVGIGSGPVFSSWFLEFVPASKRGMWMVFFSVFWAIGSVSEAALAWIVMTRLNWRWLLAISSAPSFLALFLYNLAPESPRYLCMKGRISEAHHILEKIALLNKTQLPDGILVSGRKTGADEEVDLPYNTPLLSSTGIKTLKQKSGFSSFFTLFSARLIRTTFLLWLLFFGNSFTYYGIILLTSKVASMQTKCGSNTKLSETLQDSSLYLDVFLASLGAVTVDRAGRKLSTAIMFILVFIFLVPLASHQSSIVTTSLLVGARMCAFGAFTITCIFAPEIYPTSARSSGVGLAIAMGKIGGMVSPIVAVGLVNGCLQTVAIIIFEVVIVIAVICVMFIPFETKGRPLIDTVNG